MHTKPLSIDYLMHLFTVPHKTLTVLYFVVFSYIVQLTSNTVESPPYLLCCLQYSSICSVGPVNVKKCFILVFIFSTINWFYNKLFYIKFGFDVVSCFGFFLIYLVLFHVTENFYFVPWLLDLRPLLYFAQRYECHMLILNNWLHSKKWW